MKKRKTLTLINKIVMRKRLSLLVAVVIIFIFGATLAVNNTHNPQQPQKACAQGTIEEWYECIGKALDEYMNALIAAGLPIQIGTPVFNTSSYTYDGIVSGMKNNGANFNGVDVIFINAYNVNVANGQTISSAIAATKIKFPGKKIVISETGWYEYYSGATTKQQALENLKNELDKIKNDPAVISINFFNGFGTNSGWNKFSMADDEICYAIGGCPDSSGKFGINTASFANQIDFVGVNNRLKRLGMTQVLHIYHNSDINKFTASIADALQKGITPIIRIGVGGNSGGFDQPSDFVNYLQDIINILQNTYGITDPSMLRNIIAVAGPNEPDLEHWLAKLYGCEIPEELLTEGYLSACGSPRGMEPAAMEVSVSKPWLLESRASQQDTTEENGSPSFSDLTLSTLFDVSGAAYDHNIAFEVIKKYFIGDNPDELADRILAMDPPTYLRALIPGQDIEPSYDVGRKDYGENKTIKERVKSWFPGGKTPLGKESTIEQVAIVACLQEQGTGPGSGQVIHLSGAIDFEEPPTAQLISRLGLGITNRLASAPGVHRKDFRFVKGNNVNYAKNNTPQKQNAQNPSTQNENRQKTIITNLAKPTPASAEEFSTDMPTFSMSVSAAPSGGSTYNVGISVNMQPGNLCYFVDPVIQFSGGPTPSISTGQIQYGANGTLTLSSGDYGVPFFNGAQIGLCSAGQGYTTNATIVSSGWNDRGTGAVCPTSAATSCTLCIDDDTGQLSSSCGLGVLPPPPPVSCSAPCTWAPWTTDCKGEPDQKTLIQKGECSDGNCLATISQTISADSFNICTFSTGLIGAIINWFWDCESRIKYDFYAAPIGMAADYAINRTSSDFRIQNSIALIPGITDDYFDDNTYDKQGGSLNLKVTSSEGDFKILGANTKSFDMYFPEFVEPQLSGYCLMMQMLNIPGHAFPEDSKEACESGGFGSLIAGKLDTKEDKAENNKNGNVTVTQNQNYSSVSNSQAKLLSSLSNETRENIKKEIKALLVKYHNNEDSNKPSRELINELEKIRDKYNL